MNNSHFKTVASVAYKCGDQTLLFHAQPWFSLFPFFSPLRFLHLHRSLLYTDTGLCLYAFAHSGKNGADMRRGRKQNSHSKWAATWQNQQNECAPSADSDQLGIRLVWSESSLSARKKLESLATHWARSWVEAPLQATTYRTIFN